MKKTLNLRRINWSWLVSFLLPILLFWFILLAKVPYSFSQYFHGYSFKLFVLVLLLYYIAFRLPGWCGILISFGLTLVLFALTLSYMWTSGYSDNAVMAGFLPYKDGAGYYWGANLILSGFPLENALQSSWRPLFPGFLSSMLLLMNGDLKWVLALLVLFASVGSYYSSRQVFVYWGAFPASLFITFLYFYMQPLIGLTMTELLGFTMGCLAFVLLWSVSHTLNLLDLVLGLLALVLALSIRAGTFFMLPLLTLWAGRIFRREGKFSFRVFAIALITILLTYFVSNSVYTRLIGVPRGVAFGNFAYSLYGQVQGGTGWHSAIEELGTRDPSIVYKITFQSFLEHPFSLLLGVAKSYRDFFLPFDGGIFATSLNNRLGWVNWMTWCIVIVLMIRGLIGLIKTISSNISMLLLAGFIGVFLSIPFLPPIDGGSRFYASSVPFFFIVPVAGVIRYSSMIEPDSSLKSFGSNKSFARIGVIIISLLTIVAPLIIQDFSFVPAVTSPDCSNGEKPFVIKSYTGSYIDLVPGENNCGLLPEICLSDFSRNGTQKSVDDFYQKLYSLAEKADGSVRILPAVNLVNKKLYYFFMAQSKIPDRPSSGLISGCAVEIETANRNIYQVQSIYTDGN